MTVPTACHPGPCAGVAVHGTRGVILSGRRREGSTDGTDCVVTPDLFRGHLTQFPPAYPHGSQPTAQIYWILQPLAGFQDDAASRGQHRVPRSPSCVCSSLTAHSPNLLDPSIPSGFQDDAASRGQHRVPRSPSCVTVSSLLAVIHSRLVDSAAPLRYVTRGRPQSGATSKASQMNVTKLCLFYG